MDLVNSLIERGWLKTPRIIDAFRRIKRKDFLLADSSAEAPALPAGRSAQAELDEALPTGFGQTISQPLVVAFMLELLQPQESDKILDIGSGSGWTTALLSEIVGSDGKVIGLELVPELAAWGKNNVAKYNFIENGRAEIICADASNGYEKEAPYDKILASASVQGALPEAWKRQLRPGGRLVTPIANSIWLFIKKGENNLEEKEYPGFVFVPLIKK
jgi:protein-L-isoaspartate(D-aspartate) O-methyltransferase